jgi:MoxR-like ATPase
MPESIKSASKKCEQIVDRVLEFFVGEDEIIKKVLCASISNCHILFEDYPGLGKTLLAKVFARVTGCDWKRIQFTPDLMPADIIGTMVWRQRSSSFEFVRGPIFTNIILADEINRATPKTQSALLEAMEEKQVSVEGTTYRLELPFFVMATQNPIEMEGTYPLPEAQLDRFALRLSTGYVKSLEQECNIYRRRMEWAKDDPTEDVKPVITKKEFLQLQQLAEREIYVDKNILTYIGEIVRKTRGHGSVMIGSSPRGGLSLLKLSRALALLHGRDFVTPDDVKFFATDALAHRIILDVELGMRGLSPVEVVNEVVSSVEVPKEFHPR